jgi:hypothetical protein
MKSSGFSSDEDSTPPKEVKSEQSVLRRLLQLKAQEREFLRETKIIVPPDYARSSNNIIDQIFGRFTRQNEAFHQVFYNRDLVHHILSYIYPPEKSNEDAPNFNRIREHISMGPVWKEVVRHLLFELRYDWKHHRGLADLADVEFSNVDWIHVRHVSEFKALLDQGVTFPKLLVFCADFLELNTDKSLMHDHNYSFERPSVVAHWEFWRSYFSNPLHPRKLVIHCKDVGYNIAQLDKRKIEWKRCENNVWRIQFTLSLDVINAKLGSKPQKLPPSLGTKRKRKDDTSTPAKRK